MTTVEPTTRPHPFPRAVADGVTMTRRYLLHVVRSPEELIIYFSLPIVFVLVFGYVFGSAMAVPEDGSYREFLLPGVFAMTMLYGMGATAGGIAVDVGRGVVDRFRSLPIARSSLLVRRSLTDLCRAMLEVAVLTVCGLLVGWRWHNGLVDAVSAVGLLLLLRFSLTWVGIYLGLVAKDPDTVAVVVFPAAFPLTAVANVFVSPQLMPDWLGTIAEWNPLSSRLRPLESCSAIQGPAVSRGSPRTPRRWRWSGHYLSPRSSLPWRYVGLRV